MYHFEDLIHGVTLEERVYRHRCVEAWSMVIPWIGFPVSTLHQAVRADLEGEVRPVLHARRSVRRCPACACRCLQWPYTEGLRMDEAMHPLTIFGVGLYGKVMPNQDGAPIRFVVPWNYGFKSMKSIVKIRFVESSRSTPGSSPLRTIWLLRERQSDGGSSAVEPGARSPAAWPLQKPRDRRCSTAMPIRSRDVHRNGFEVQLLTSRDPATSVALAAEASRFLAASFQRSTWPSADEAPGLHRVAVHGDLSANPLSDVTNGTGDWTIRFVCLTLAITPLRQVTGWNLLIRFRRMIGLFAFFYGTLALSDLPHRSIGSPASSCRATCRVAAVARLAVSVAD